MSDVVSYEVVDGVAHVTIERPEVRNAMDLAVFDALHERARQAAADDAVGAVLLAGRGGSFSSGLDVSVLLGGGGDGDGDGPAPLTLDVDGIGRLQAAFTAYEDLDKPTVAAIEGYCFGAGIQLAAACHVRLVAPDASLSVMEARWALVPDLGGTYRLPRLVGLGRATELVLTARRIDAAEAVHIGLAEVALDAEDPLGRAHAYAAKLAAGPGALRRVPRLLRDNLERPRDAALRTEAETQLACLGGPDVQEAVAAAMEGRAPSFVGR